MLVWLTEWQLAEEALLISVGETVAWRLYPADAEWTSRLFGDRLSIDWQFDTYGSAVEQPSLDVIGVVERLQLVRCRQMQTREGIVPVRGEATLHEVADTSSSWAAPAALPVNGYPVPGSPVHVLPVRGPVAATGPVTATEYEGAYSEFTGEGAYGFVVSLRVSPPGPLCASAARA